MTEKVERRLAAILSADVVAYSRLIAADEEGTLARLRALREEFIDPKFAEHRGRIVKLMGDGVLVEFASVVDAVRCAAEIQREMATRNTEVSEDQRIVFRIGINLGDVVIEGDDIYGDGVNISARLEQLSEPGGIIISGTAFDQVRDRLDLGYEDIGEQAVKNIPRPVRAYRVLLDPAAAGEIVALKKTKAGFVRRWRWALSAAAAAIVVAIAAGVLLTLEPWAPHVEAAIEANMAFPLPDKPSIVVLPFENIGDDPEQAYFSAGVTSDIIAHLSTWPDLFVIDRQSSYAYLGKQVTVKQVAEELGVRYVLQGSVQRSGEKLRINTQLIDALSGRHVWSGRYDRKAAELFALQDDITRHVATELAVNLMEGEIARTWRSRAGENLEAWALYTQAQQIGAAITKQTIAQARQLTTRAIEIGGEQSAFFAGLAWFNLHEAMNGWSEDPTVSFQKAIEFVNRAQELDESNLVAYEILGHMAFSGGRLAEAIEYAELMVAISPNSSEAHFRYSLYLSFADRPVEALEEVQTAIRLSPFYPPYFLWALGEAYFGLGRYEELIEVGEEWIRRVPEFSNAFLGIAMGHWELGHVEEAKAAIEELLKRRPDFSMDEYRRVLPYENLPKVKREIALLRAMGLPEHPPLPLPDKPSIAVLPFTNMSGDPEQEYFSDGITEQIIAELTRFDGLFVIARNSTFRYKGRSVDVREVGQELGARYVLEGSVRRAADTIRVTAQLLDVTVGAYLWAETYERGLSADSVFAVQDDITEHVVGALADPHGIISRARMREAVKKKTGSLSAYDCVLRVYAYRRSFRREEHQRVRDCMERAVQLDPDYVDAWAWLALIYSDEYRYEYNTRPNALERSLAAAQRAVTLDSTSQLAHWILARTYFWLHRIDDFLTEAEKAIALNPNNSEVVASSGMYMANSGQWERGVELTKKAIALNPGHPDWYYFTFFFDHYRNGEDEQALAVARKINMPSFWWTHATLAAVHAQLGHQDEARAALERLLELYPSFPDKPREIFQRWNFRESLIDRLIEGLHIAGLPDRSS